VLVVGKAKELDIGHDGVVVHAPHLFVKLFDDFPKALRL
jgi:hypothetical protein